MGEGGKGRGAHSAVVCMLLRLYCRNRTTVMIAIIIVARPTMPPVIALARPVVCWMVAAVIGNVTLYDAKMVSRRELMDDALRI